MYSGTVIFFQLKAYQDLRLIDKRHLISRSLHLPCSHCEDLSGFIEDCDWGGGGRWEKIAQGKTKREGRRVDCT